MLETGASGVNEGGLVGEGSGINLKEGDIWVKKKG